MANLPPDHTIHSNGNHEIPNLIPGRQYLLTLRTAGAATATLHFNDGPGGSFSAVQGGAMLGGGPTEVRLAAPSTTLRITASGVNSPIRVNLLPIH